MTPLRRLMFEGGWTQTQLSKATGLTMYAVWAAVNGISMSDEHAQLIADALGVRKEQLNVRNYPIAGNPGHHPNGRKRRSEPR
jgi:transcriptional regulator with XRE-family HTH domain